ncbi:MAG: DUF2804 domain-containing protein [Promethearchaeota archaeon]|nr:MAG: DUF2804 domain-containing protein [Candidatus Lokiarchaeota archaeon]
MNNEIKESGNLFDKEGNLLENGWARKLILNYNKEDIRVGKKSLRIKEWDCYCIVNESYCLTLIIADIGYFGMGTISWIDFKNQEQKNGGAIKLFTRGKLNMPPTADTGDVSFKRNKFKLNFKREGDYRVLSVANPGFCNDKGIEGEVKLYQDPEMDTMVNVIPFKNKKHFVYVQKVNCMPTSGSIRIGEDRYDFSDKDTFSCLDWSRGVFPYKTSWYWGSASGIIDGKMVGFNIDYGFGDESVASKNMIFHEGKGHKLDQITFHINKKDFMEPWRFTSNDGRFEMTLNPVYHEKTNLNLLFLKTSGHKVYGYYNGDLILDNGEKLHIDNLFGFAENFHHRW